MIPGALRTRTTIDPWRLAWLAGLIAIPTTAAGGSAWLGALRGLVDGAALAGVLAALVGTMIAVPAAGVLRLRPRIGWMRFTGAVAAISVVLVGVPPGPRWVHTVLFLPFGFLSVRAFDARTAAFTVVLVAAGDEGFQYLLPERTGSLLDVGINTLSGLAGALLAPPRARRPQRV